MRRSAIAWGVAALCAAWIPWVTGSAAIAQTRSASASGPVSNALAHVDRYFITQYAQHRYNPNQPGAALNANCGPTSLAMALRAFGKEPRTMADAAGAYRLIRSVRIAMTGSDDEDDWTYPVQIKDAARQYGLHSRIVFTLPKIESAMSVPGRLMIVNVNPCPAYVDQLAYRCDGGHFALLTRIAGDRAFLNDPLGPGPIVITLKQLDKALTTPLGRDASGHEIAPFDGGVLLWR